MPVTFALFLALAVLALLLASVVWAVIAPSYAVSAFCLGLAVLWVLVNKPVEGPVLLAFDKEHGATLSDIMSILSVLVAAHTLRRRMQIRDTRPHEKGNRGTTRTGS